MRTPEQVQFDNAMARLRKLRKIRAKPKPDARKPILHTAQQRARKYRMRFNLKLEDISIPETCPVLGIAIDPDGPTANRPSIDRIDNSKGYIRGNVVVVSFRANRLKSDATIAELQALAKFYAGFT